MPFSVRSAYRKDVGHDEENEVFRRFVQHQESRQDGEDQDEDDQRTQRAIIRCDGSEASGTDYEHDQEAQDKVDAPADAERDLNLRSTVVPARISRIALSQTTTADQNQIRSCTATFGTVRGCPTNCKPRLKCSRLL